MLSIATLMGFACAHAQTPRASHTQTQCGRSRDVGRSAGRRSGRPTFISVHLVSCWNSETFVFQYLSNFASKSLGTHSRAHRPGRNRAAARRRGGVTASRVAIAKSQSKPLATQATHLSSDGSSPGIVARPRPAMGRRRRSLLRHCAWSLPRAGRGQRNQRAPGPRTNRGKRFCWLRAGRRVFAPRDAAAPAPAHAAAHVAAAHSSAFFSSPRRTVPRALSSRLSRLGSSSGVQQGESWASIVRGRR